MIVKKKSIYRALVLFLLVCSAWITISVFIFVRFDSPINFSHVSVLLSVLILALVGFHLKLDKVHGFLIFFFIGLLIISSVYFFFIKNLTITYINPNFKNHSIYKYLPNPIFNSRYLFIKEYLHLIFALITIIVSSIIIKSSLINLDDFKRLLQKYLYYLLLFYILLYVIFLKYEDVIAIISTNQHNGFRSFLNVKNQYFLDLFKNRLGITLSEPSFSGLYVIIFSPFAFVKSKFRSRILILLPCFLLLNSSKYAIAAALLIGCLYLVIMLINVLKSKKYFIYFLPLLFTSFFGVSLFFIEHINKFKIILDGKSSSSRLFSMFSGLSFFQDNFLFGIGLGQYPIKFIESFSDTTYLENILIRTPSAQSMFVSGLAEFGIYYAIFILFLILFLIKSFRRDKLLFFSSVILVLNLNASAGNGFNMIYYWVLLTFYTFYAFEGYKK